MVYTCCIRILSLLSFLAFVFMFSSYFQSVSCFPLSVLLFALTTHVTIVSNYHACHYTCQYILVVFLFLPHPCLSLLERVLMLRDRFVPVLLWIYVSGLSATAAPLVLLIKYVFYFLHLPASCVYVWLFLTYTHTPTHAHTRCTMQSHAKMCRNLSTKSRGNLCLLFISPLSWHHLVLYCTLLPSLISELYNEV